MCECNRWMAAVKMFVVGLILILITLYTNWDLGLVLGVLVIIKGLLIAFMPMHSCSCETKGKKKRR